MSRQCDWSNLNHDILRLIADKVMLKDFTCIADVCSKWKSGLHWSDFGHLQLPWLMLPCPHENSIGGMRKCQWQCQCHRRRSFSVMENKVYDLNFPEAYGKKCVGTSHGWMIMVEDVSPAIFMLNPLTRQRIELPPVTTMLPDILGFDKEEAGREYLYKDTFCGRIDRYSLKEIENFFTLKVILSHDPNDEDCVAVAICGQLRQLAFCRVGHDYKWTPVQDLRTPQSDVIYSKGKFYAVNCHGMVGVFDVKNPQVTIIHEAPPGIKRSDAMYLAVDTRGKLLHISRNKKGYDTLSEAEHDDENNDDDDDDVNDNVNHADDDNNNNGDDNDQNDVNDNIDHGDDQEKNGDEDNDVNDSGPTYFLKTKKFNIFKLDEKNNLWDKVRDIGDNIIFLGDNHSICYSASEFPDCNGNSIYFTDDYWEYECGLYGGYDVGIFDIDFDEGRGLVTKIPCFKEQASFLTIFPRPVWFAPSIRLLD